VKRTYRLVWWPDQGYFDLTPQRFFSTIFDRERMRNIFQIVFYRRYPVQGVQDRFRDLTEWPNRHEFEMYVRRDIVADIWDLDLLPGVVLQDPLEAAIREREINLEAVAVHDAIYDDLPLLRPRAVAVGPNGERVIADSGNHRIVVLDQTGAFQYAFGSHCRLGEGEAGGCVDDFGFALGDGQFYEPWGVAVGPNGDIFVADTWNGRIQVFDAEGQFLRKWGYFSSTGGELTDPYALFGPRGIAVDQQGNLVVTDTGNKRILHFTPDGQLIQQAGGGGVILGRFEEPTAVEVDPQTGFVFVADAWNRRVQVLSADLEPLAEWPVPGWSSREIFHKPSITRAANGDIYLTDPQLFRVIVLSPLGEIKAAFGSYGPELNRFGLPNGISYDPAANQVLVADADNNRILAYPALP
jgi:DNA-binding beta-propeller fold protein YncE